MKQTAFLFFSLLALSPLGAMMGFSVADVSAQEQMMYGDTTRVGVPYAKDPHVIKFKGRYLMYYSIPPAQWNGMEGWNIGIAESRDLVSWTRIGEMTPQKGLEYERKGFCAPCAIVSFVVDIYGTTSGYRLVKGLGGAFDEEALRVAKPIEIRPGKQKNGYQSKEAPSPIDLVFP